jgi:hypothetical protein
MNTLADNALFEAFICGRTQMTRVDVERAHRDLGWVDVAAGASAPGAAILALPAADPAFQHTMGELDPALASMVTAAQVVGRAPLPVTGPPKVEEAEPEDLLVELIEG